MRRLSLLLGLTLFVSSLAGGAGGIGAPLAGLARARAATDETSPHWGCVGNQCVLIYACGVDDCSACPGCNPSDEYNCIVEGGTWNPSTCTCTPHTCDPWAEFDCAQQWGSWDESTCTCWNPCNPGPPVVVYTESGQTLLWCTACYMGAVDHWEINYYHQYCQDGRLWDSYSIGVGTVYEDFAWECWDWCIEY